MAQCGEEHAERLPAIIGIGARASGCGDDGDHLARSIRVLRRHSGVDPGLVRDVRCTRGSHDNRGVPGGGDARCDHVRRGAPFDRLSRLCPSHETEDAAVAHLVESVCRHGGWAHGAAGRAKKAVEVGRACRDRIECADSQWGEGHCTRRSVVTVPHTVGYPSSLRQRKSCLRSAEVGSCHQKDRATSQCQG